MPLVQVRLTEHGKLAVAEVLPLRILYKGKEQIAAIKKVLLVVEVVQLLGQLLMVDQY